MVSPLGRLVEIAEDNRHLAKDRGFLTVHAGGAELGRVPIEDLGGVIASGHGITLSLPLAAALAERGVALVLCGAAFQPVALLWPLVGHHAQQRRMEAQIARSAALAPGLRAQIVAAKLRRQGWALGQAGARGGAFDRLASSVRPGDPDNLEARGARRYWPLLFGRAFRRDAEGGWPNPALNYGYAVLRAATARALCGAGLHPTLGLFHRHPHNPMPLADDLMEPFRPLVDLAVLRLDRAGERAVTPAAKRALAAVLAQDLVTAAGRTPLATCVQRLAQSLAACFEGGGGALDLPVVAADDGRADDEPPF